MIRIVVGLVALSTLSASADEPADRVFRAGAAAVDVSPRRFPVLVNGGFLQAQSSVVVDPLHSRALVLDDGRTRLAIVVVDSCMMPRELIDRAKEKIRAESGIPANHVLVSATHTHTAPAAMGALGCGVAESYSDELPSQIAESVAKAVGRLAPARIGWGSVVDEEHTHCRRWIRRPDRLLNDPFGVATVRANMHPGYLSPDVVGPAGPVDPQLSVVSVVAPDDRPIALLANYSMHYFGTTPVSADYFGMFCKLVASQIGGDENFVAMISQGTSGDQHWMDYGRAKTELRIDQYAEGVAQSAMKAVRSIEYHDWVPLGMEETTLRLRRRVPDAARLAWAWPLLVAMRDRPPQNQPEVYAREAAYLKDSPKRTLKLQAVRIGDLGIAAIPNEVFALTGLKIKAQSPFSSTFNIELANGGEGYIPPPEQHTLGGYTTWPARTAALERGAEPRIVEAVLTLLEKVAGRARKTPESRATPYEEAIRRLKPWGYWRLDEMAEPVARDATGQGHDAHLVGGHALYLEGVPIRGASQPRAVHLAGGRVEIPTTGMNSAYTTAFWFWNGLPTSARDVTATLLDLGSPKTRLTLGGKSAEPGCLRLGDQPGGTTSIEWRSWHHVVYRRDGRKVTVWLDGRKEYEGNAADENAAPRSISIGGSAGSDFGLEGRIDEIAVFDRAVDGDELRFLGEAAGLLDANGER